MRILQLQFKNLNSLAGEWLVDLSHENFVEDGIFAIVGPTGAGKTTILDALCLALYGRTPRLANISQSGNEIMSRKCGECFAEVVFETPSGRFRCHWSQHRARKIASGELQPPKHEIADCASGKVLEHGPSKVRPLIESITGMKFDQFTRAVLLAQGDFAAFLQASAAERAPLLEQITGTEIYSEISIRVHERQAAELRKKLALESKTQAIQRVNPLELEQIKRSIEALRNSSAALKESIKDNEAELQCLKQLSGLEADSARLSLAEREHEQESVHFSTEQARLERALRGLELATDYEKLRNSRTEFAQMLARLEVIELEFTAAQGACSETAALLQSAVETSTRCQENAERMSPLIQKARELDAFLFSTKQSLTAQVARTSEIARQLELAHEKKDACHKELLQCEEQLQKTLHWFELNKDDAGLSESLEALKLQLQALKSCQLEKDTLLAEQTIAADTLHRANSAALAKRDELLQIAAEFQVKQAHLCQRRNELRLVLGLPKLNFVAASAASDLAAETAEHHFEQSELDLNDEHELIEELRRASSLALRQESQFEKIAAAASELQSACARFDFLESAQKECASRLAELQREKLRKCELRESYAQNKSLLESQLALVNALQSYEEARAQLREGDACPLCGALEHPFAQGNLPMPSATAQELEILQEKSVVLESELKALELEASVQQTMQGNRAEECTLLNSRAEKSKAVIRETAQTLGGVWLEAQLAICLPGLETAAALQAQRVIQLVREEAEKTGAQKKKVAESLAVVSVLESDIRKVQGQFFAIQSQFASAKLELQDAMHSAAVAQKLCEDLGKQIEAAEHSAVRLLESLRLSLPHLSPDSFNADALSLVVEDLCLRELKWKEMLTEKLHLELRMAQIKINSENYASKSTDLARSKQQESALLQQITAQLDQAAALRRATFEEKSPDAVELNLRQAATAAQLSLKAAQEKHNKAVEERRMAETLRQELLKAVPGVQRSIALREELFNEQIAERGFVSEDDFCSAMMTDHERSVLYARAQNLRERKVALVSRRADLETKLVDLRSSLRLSLSQETLTSVIDNSLLELERIQKEMGAAEQQIREHDRVMGEWQRLWVDLEKQKTELTKWQNLHELIGSADGRKFRNFAQGITLQILIGQANLQLEKMNDRYILVKKGEEGLELGVVDTYQAGELRSVKNLSGGESFVVSLALALGLSAMASSKLRIDSLFLDEGFGTLDEEVLEVALDTLASLKDDGKLVGIISHVVALKERISCQIRVQPMGGGRSVLTGPGVKKL